MTERFVIDTSEKNVKMKDKQYNCFYVFIDNVENIEIFCERLNELQRHLDVMISGALTDDKRIKELYDENEQLKLLNNYLTELLKDLNGVSIEIEKVKR